MQLIQSSNCTDRALLPIAGQFVLCIFKHRRVDEILDNIMNPINGEHIKDARDGDVRVPRDVNTLARRTRLPGLIT